MSTATPRPGSAACSSRAAASTNAPWPGPPLPASSHPSDHAPIAGRRRVAATRDVLLQRRAAQDRRPAVDAQHTTAPRQLAQADAGAVAALERDDHLQLVEHAVAGAPEVGVGDDDVAHERARRTGNEVD